MYSVILLAAMTSGTTTSPVIFYHNGGGCRGCYGCTGCVGCVGCTGCIGTCTGYCYGWSSGCWGTCYGCHGCYGCYGCYGCTGGWNYVPVKPDKKPEEVPPPKKDDKKDEASAYRARLIVELPADAKLFVDDYATRTSGGAVRTFTTPVLEPEQDYYYILRCETVRDGKTIAETRRVVVRAGMEVRTSFNGAPTEAITETSKIGR
jgi:uncharacterized protein (TIGR03000 family)